MSARKFTKGAVGERGEQDPDCLRDSGAGEPDAVRALCLHLCAELVEGASLTTTGRLHGMFCAVQTGGSAILALLRKVKVLRFRRRPQEHELRHLKEPNGEDHEIVTATAA